MRVLHVVYSISEESSGSSQAAAALCRAEAALGAKVTLAYEDYGGTPAVPGVETLPFARTTLPVLRFASWSTGLLAYVVGHAREYDLIHAHGLFNFAPIYCGWAHALRGVPMVASPHGMLAEWGLARSRKKKAIAMAVGQRYALRASAFIHATSDAEAREIRAFGLTNPIVLAPNGVAFEPARTDVARNQRRVLFLSRLHPVKALDRLLDAWKIVEAHDAAAELVVAGPSADDYGDRMRAYARTLGLRRVRFVGEILGDAKRELYASSAVFVLPSATENFGMVVVEALAEGALVVASRGTPWAELEREGVGRWVENSPAELAGAIVSLLALPPRDVVERRGKAVAWVRERFDVANAARVLLDAYRGIVAGEGYKFE